MFYENLDTETLLSHADNTAGCKLSPSGVLYTHSGLHTGRSPDAKKIVIDDLTRDTVDWVNNEGISTEEFDNLYSQFLIYRNSCPQVYVQNVTAVRDPQYSLPIKVYTETAHHSLFVRNMFIPNTHPSFKESYTIFHFPNLSKEPQVIISFKEKTILISGTHYSGEIKKSIFTVLNYWFPIGWKYLSMHCSVNVDLNRENPAIFFGLSGTGKTTLSSERGRILIGDDEHGWTSRGLVNFEGGCYAKTIRLSKEDEPDIYHACSQKGTMLENVVIKNGIPDYDDATLSENARASYPTKSLPGADPDGFVNLHPKNIVMLTCDSFGVLPPVAKLSSIEAVEQFLLGYTSKVAGTEAGIKEPQATFSPCFGQPFMPLPAYEYAKLLKVLIEEHSVNCWLVNTGWTGGPYGVGSRIPISVTRDIIKHVHSGDLANSRTHLHEYTGLTVPLLDSIPRKILHPEEGWDDIEEYKYAAYDLISKFTLSLRHSVTSHDQNQS